MFGLKVLEKLAFVVIITLFAFVGYANAQTSVTLALGPHPQFLDGTGKPLAAGLLYFFAAGTSTPQNTFADNLGTIANSNPIALDATGAPSNGSGTQVQVWFSNASYKLCLYSSTLVQQWCSDNFSGYSILNNIPNITFGSVTSDPSGFAGEFGYRSDLGCFRGFSTFWDCFATLTGIQTLTNKTLTAPIINNAVGSTFISPSITGLTVGGIAVASGNPTNFSNFTNGAAGTTLNMLAKLVPLGAGAVAVNTAITDTGGVVGIVVGGAGTTGIDVIQSSGQALCVFDGSTTRLDYVQISSTALGNCHDTGSTIYPSSGGQIIGRSLGTNAGVGTYLFDLFPHEIQTAASASVPCTTVGPVTITNNNTQQNLLSCTIPANALAAGSLLNVDLTGLESTASSGTVTISASLGGGTVCLSGFLAGIANNQPYNFVAKFATMTAGAGGTGNWSCEIFGPGAGVQGNGGAIGIPTISINTTIPNLLQLSIQMSVANAGNSTTAQLLKATIF